MLDEFYYLCALVALLLSNAAVCLARLFSKLADSFPLVFTYQGDCPVCGTMVKHSLSFVRHMDVPIHKGCPASTQLPCTSCKTLTWVRCTLKHWGVGVPAPDRRTLDS